MKKKFLLDQKMELLQYERMLAFECARRLDKHEAKKSYRKQMKQALHVCNEKELTLRRYK